MSKSVSAEPDIINNLLTQPIPKNLWHYTSYEAFRGIVESKKIFATDLRYLNDRQEFLHAKDLAEKMADEIVDPSDIGMALREMLKKAVNLAFNTGPLRSDRLQVMVTSFSHAQDQLGQWRGYSGASRGVSISFDLSKFRPPVEIGTMAVFAPCVYEVSQQKALLRSALSHMTKVWTEWIKDVQEAVQEDSRFLEKIKTVAELGPPHVKGLALHERMQPAMDKVNFDLVRLCPLLKDSSFSEEREWRLVLPMSMDCGSQPEKHYRSAFDTLVPYVKYPLSQANEPAPVNDLILGPGSHVEAKTAVFSFLQNKRIMVTPQNSTVPYRAS